jgi:hypothetical protein
LLPPGQKGRRLAGRDPPVLICSCNLLQPATYRFLVQKKNADGNTTVTTGP